MRVLSAAMMEALKVVRALMTALSRASMAADMQARSAPAVTLLELEVEGELELELEAEDEESANAGVVMAAPNRRVATLLAISFFIDTGIGNKRKDLYLERSTTSNVTNSPVREFPKTAGSYESLRSGVQSSSL